jgi:hypothetical protein
MRALQIGRKGGMFLDCDVMQPRRGFGIGQQSMRRAKEVEPETEAGLENRERLAPAPTLGQIIAGEEYVPRLFRSALGCVVDVVVRCRTRYAALIEDDAARSQGGGQGAGRRRLP